jgi:hypothetical protein
VVTVASSAGASATKNPGQVGPSAAQIADSGVSPDFGPPGWVLVSGGSITAPGLTQTHGSLTCPGHKQPTGGGAFVASAGFPVFLNSSYPTSNGWNVDVNNQSTVSSGFNEYLICLGKNTTYSMTVGDVATAVNNAQSSSSVTCPRHKIVVGGGVLSFSGNTNVNINTSYPSGNGWRADMNNTSGADTQFQVYVVCRHAITGYAVVSSGLITNPTGGGQTIASTSCPGTEEPMSGGGFSSSPSTSVYMNSSFPNSSDGWTVFEQNFSGASTFITAYAVCGGV